MVPIVCSYIWGNMLVSLVAEYHFPYVGSFPTLATWNKGIAFILVWHICHPTMVSQGRGSWTSGWISSGSVVYKSLSSNIVVWYGWNRSTLNTRCRPRHEGMLSWKLFSPICLRIMYGPYSKGFSFMYGPVKRLLEMQPNLICNLKWMGDMIDMSI